MRVETLGDGDPDIAVAGAIHGDEPCGARAIERFLAEDPPIRRPVRLIVANERALERGVRYVDADLNRVFPGDPDSAHHEERLAAEFVRAIEGCTTLGFHSTVSTPEPFASVADLDPEKRAVAAALPVERVADFTGVVEGRGVNLPDVVNVEAGYQGSDAAAENAYDCLTAFLRFAGALPGEVEGSTTTRYEVFETVEKVPGRDYRVLAENFERVERGEVYATADGREVRAEEAFYPVLMSGDGHSRLLGYKARRAETIDPPERATARN